jgi:rhamnose utilization protein RhaD (predicted bifunctional aldolase and dehydrogenase)
LSTWTQPAELAALARLSVRVGSDITLVQAAGGNSSLKLDGVLWVKASGTWLADAEQKPIFVPVDLAAARAALGAGNEKIPALADSPTNLRPSIETSLHALMPHRVVLHVHAVNSIAWAVRADARRQLEQRLAGLAWVWLDYCRPGVPLAARVAAATAGKRPDVLILGNHGLVVGAADCDAAEALVHEVERRLALPVRATPAADTTRLETLCRNSPYRPAAFDECHAAAGASHHVAIATGGSLYPDHVVFLGPGARALHGHETIAEITQTATAAGLPPPSFLLVPGLGTIIRTDLPPDAEPILRCLGLVVARLPADAEVIYLPPEEEQALLNWDAEHYRKSLSLGRAASPAAGSMPLASGA